MKKDIAMKWVEALRSGKYKQGSPGELKSESGYCCLGVLCEISEVESIFNPVAGRWLFGAEKNYGTVPNSLQKLYDMKSGLGFRLNNKSPLCELNDHINRNGTRMSFNEIADIIEKEWEDL